MNNASGAPHPTGCSTNPNLTCNLYVNRPKTTPFSSVTVDASVFDVLAWESLPPLERCDHKRSLNHLPPSRIPDPPTLPSYPAWYASSIDDDGSEAPLNNLKVTSLPTTTFLWQTAPQIYQLDPSFHPRINKPPITHGAVRRDRLTKIPCSSCHTFRGIVTVGLPCRHVLCSKCLKLMFTRALRIDDGIVVCCGNAVSVDVAKWVLGKKKGQLYEKKMYGTVQQERTRRRWNWMKGMGCGWFR